MRLGLPILHVRPFPHQLLGPVFYGFSTMPRRGILMLYTNSEPCNLEYMTFTTTWLRNSYIDKICY